MQGFLFPFLSFFINFPIRQQLRLLRLFHVIWQSLSFACRLHPVRHNRILYAFLSSQYCFLLLGVGEADKEQGVICRHWRPIVVTLIRQFGRSDRKIYFLSFSCSKKICF